MAGELFESLLLSEPPHGSESSRSLTEPAARFLRRFVLAIATHTTHVDAAAMQLRVLCGIASNTTCFRDEELEHLVKVAQKFELEVKKIGTLRRVSRIMRHIVLALCRHGDLASISFRQLCRLLSAVPSDTLLAPAPSGSWEGEQSSALPSLLRDFLGLAGEHGRSEASC